MEHTSPPFAKMAVDKGLVLPEQTSKKIRDGQVKSDCMEVDGSITLLVGSPRKLLMSGCGGWSVNSMSSGSETGSPVLPGVAIPLGGVEACETEIICGASSSEIITASEDWACDESQ